ncbi:hypothetical protein C8R44DRAFT_734696 [Mycena epipterygia]|nr:hypothetical protein C8R44DRAFT_734696 [Mycena epipterygia]
MHRPVIDAVNPANNIVLVHSDLRKDTKRMANGKWIRLSTRIARRVPTATRDLEVWLDIRVGGKLDDATDWSALSGSPNRCQKAEPSVKNSTVLIPKSSRHSPDSTPPQILSGTRKSTEQPYLPCPECLFFECPNVTGDYGCPYSIVYDVLDQYDLTYCGVINILLLQVRNIIYTRTIRSSKLMLSGTFLRRRPLTVSSLSCHKACWGKYKPTPGQGKAVAIEGLSRVMLKPVIFLQVEGRAGCRKTVYSNDKRATCVTKLRQSMHGHEPPYWARDERNCSSDLRRCREKTKHVTSEESGDTRIDAQEFRNGAMGAAEGEVYRRGETWGERSKGGGRGKYSAGATKYGTRVMTLRNYMGRGARIGIWCKNAEVERGKTCLREKNSGQQLRVLPARTSARERWNTWMSG